MSFEFPPPGPHEKQGRAQLKTQNSKLKTAAAVLMLTAVGISVGCSHRSTARPSAKPRPPSPQVEDGWTEKGIASWYGEPYHGRRTASGEVYDMHAMTAAHKTLPFGTVVKVDRRDTGADVTVRINDRGPFIEGRIIDLSYAAATGDRSRHRRRGAGQDQGRGSRGRSSAERAARPGGRDHRLFLGPDRRPSPNAIAPFGWKQSWRRVARWR